MPHQPLLLLTCESLSAVCTLAALFTICHVPRRKKEGQPLVPDRQDRQTVYIIYNIYR